MARTFADLEARVRGLESRADRNEEDITALITTSSETLTRVRRVETRVTRMDKRLENVETELEGVKAELGGVKTQVGGLDARVRRVERGVDAIAEHLGVRVPEDAAGE